MVVRYECAFPNKGSFDSRGVAPKPAPNTPCSLRMTESGGVHEARRGHSESQSAGDDVGGLHTLVMLSG